MNRQEIGNDIELSLRLLAGIFLVYSAVTTPILFDHFSQYESTKTDIYGAALLWSFFHYSLTVPIFVGVLEAIGGLLLVYDRTKLIGASLLFPLFFNFVMFDFFYDAPALAKINSIAVLSVLLFLFYREWPRIDSVIRTLSIRKVADISHALPWWARALMLCFFLAICFFSLQWIGWGVVWSRQLGGV